MPPGYPGGPANAHQPPPFLGLDSLHSTPQGRWESLKLLRLLGWAWMGTPGWPRTAPNAEANHYITALPPGPTGLVYSTILATLRLSGVAEMLGIALPGAVPPATSVAHIDNDWFGDVPKNRASHIYPWKWKGLPVTEAESRERNFLREMMYALDRSLGLDSIGKFEHPDRWLTGPAPQNWPPLQGAPANAAAKLIAPLDAPLVENKPIDHYWDNSGKSIFRFQTLVGAQRVSFVVTTPHFDYP